MDWREEYKRRATSPEDAVKVVESGNRVVIPRGGEPQALISALAKRREELRDVELWLDGLRTDYGWMQPGWEESFRIVADQSVSLVTRPALDKRRIDYSPMFHSTRFKADDDLGSAKTFDVCLTAVSPPDRNGFCSFGNHMGNKKSYARRSKHVLAQVDERFIRTYGDNFIHVSEIERFVEIPLADEDTTARPLETEQPTEFAAMLLEYIKPLLRDGDTIQMGPGLACEPLPYMGLFDGLQDLGCHTAFCIRGQTKAIVSGRFAGRRKTVHQGKAVACWFYGDDSDLAFIDGNPMFELYTMEHTNSIPVIAAHDNMVAINGALAVDLTGQIAADSIGPRLVGGAGGQAEFAIGTALSKGGRNVTVLRSTASDGKISRIVPLLERGTVVSVHRAFADYIATEYGVARLMGKTVRQRCEALIAIAHPDFRAELRKEAEKLYWP